MKEGRVDKREVEELWVEEKEDEEDEEGKLRGYGRIPLASCATEGYL